MVGVAVASAVFFDESLHKTLWESHANYTCIPDCVKSNEWWNSAYLDGFDYLFAKEQLQIVTLLRSL